MAKRFTDTEKWKKQWYRKLGAQHRDLRQYVLDFCDHAGFWDVDLETAQHFTGNPVTINDLKMAFDDKIIFINEEKVFIPDFIKFQYGQLSEDSKPHKSVISELKKHRVYKGYSKGIDTLKDKDKDKDKESNVSKSKIEELYQKYPKRPSGNMNKAAGMKALKKFSKKKLADFEKALDVFASKVSTGEYDPQFIPMWSSFVNGKWEDWLDQEETKKQEFITIS